MTHLPRNLIILAVAVMLLVSCVLGCSAGPVYEYRVIEETEGGFLIYRGEEGGEAPRMRDGWIELFHDDEVKFLSAEDVEIKRVQVGPHECRCGAILRTYRDRCHQCGGMILFGCRTPPKGD